jgi:hypothetical protein
MFERFLSTANAGRAESCLRTLQHHAIEEWALTGGLAIEIQRARLGRDVPIRRLNDIDFVAASFDCIPDTMADDFLFLHVHPFDPPGKTMAQLVNASDALRIDVFRVNTTVMQRSTEVSLPGGTIRVVAPEDLLARAARLTLPLVHGLPVPSKHARDFLALLELVSPADVENAWEDHRRSHDPATFREAAVLLRDLISHRCDLLITPIYSQDPLQPCPRCIPTGRFQRADPALILSILGYC